MVSTVLFAVGVLTVLLRRGAIVILMGIELVLNAASLNFVAFSRYSAGTIDGQVVSVFIIILAAAEAAIALAIVLNIYQNFDTVNVDEVNRLRD